MSPRDLWSRRKPDEPPAPHGGYFALHEAYGDAPSVADRFEDWDRRLDAVGPVGGTRMGGR
jgi:penicillin-binding protein 1A